MARGTREMQGLLYEKGHLLSRQQGVQGPLVQQLHSTKAMLWRKHTVESSTLITSAKSCALRFAPTT
eukprot:1157896-Pelagomonas_calceolata.AAC.9